MELIQTAKLHAELFPGGRRYTQHVHETSRPGQRAVRQIERWEREPNVLGKGAFGTVYLEKCTYSDSGSLGKSRAVKVVKKEVVHYQRELEAVVLFSHEKYRRYFVESFGWYETPKEIFIAMEYLPHGDLQQYLATQNVHQIPESEVKVIVLQILEGLQHMHDLSVTHRDIKPKNILIVELGPTWWVKITDFGVSKQCLDNLTALRTNAGTDYYRPPEVLEHTLREEQGERAFFSYTNAVDVWAVGTTAYVLLLGDVPFRDSTLQKMRDYGCGKLEFPAEAMREKGLSADAYDFTKSLMAPQPGDRPDVADCLAHQWLEQFTTPIDDVPDAFTQAIIDQDSQASRSWNSDPSMANTALNQQETLKVQSDWPSRLPLSSTYSQDSGIHMPESDTPHSTEYKVSPQSAGQTFRQQAPELEARETANQTRASTSSAKEWCVDKELKYDSGEIKALALSPDGSVLVSGGDDKVIRVWDTKKWRQAGMLDGHTGTITDLAFCPGGKWVVSASTDKTVRVWDVETLESVATVPGGYTAKTWAVAVSPDGALLATGDGGGDLMIFALSSEVTPAQAGTKVSNYEEKPLQKPLRAVRGLQGVYGLAFSPDGKLLASAGDDGVFSTNLVKLWDPHTMSLVATLNHKSWWANELYGLTFSRDGKMLVSAGTDSIRIWDVATGVELKRCTKFDTKVYCAHFFLDGRLAFGDSLSVRVWDAQAAEESINVVPVRELSWRSIGVSKVVSWPDGTFATAADTIKIWRPVTAVQQE